LCGDQDQIAITMKTKSIVSSRWLLRGGVLTALLAFVGGAANAANTYITKANNNNNLNSGTSWVSGTAPNASNTIAVWNNTLTGPITTVLGGPLTVGGMVFSNNAGLVTINSDGNTLTNYNYNTYSINLLSSTNGLNLNCNIALGGNNGSWIVGTNQTLTVGGNAIVNAANGSTNLTIGAANAGTVSLNTPGGVFNSTTAMITVNGPDTSAAAFAGIPGLTVAQSDTLNSLSIGTGSIMVSGPGTLTVRNSIHPNIAANKTCTIGCNLAGTANFQETGQGGSVLSGHNTYTGGTWLNFANAKVTISGSGTLGPGWLTLSGGTTGAQVVDLGGTTQSVGPVTNNPANGTGTIQDGTLSGSSYNLYNNAIVSANLAGSGVNLTKLGPGTATISGGNTYSGNTIVSAGTLTMSGGSIANSTNISVASGATFNVSAVNPFTIGSGQTLTGAGTVSGQVTVASGGILTPGNAVGGGVLTMNDLTLSSGSTVNVEFPSAGSPGNASVNNADGGGGLVINGGSVYLYQAGTTTPCSQGGTFTLFSYSNGAIGGAGVGALTVANPQAGYNYSFADTGNGGSSGLVTVTINSPLVVYWNVDASGSWASASDWTPAFVPNAVDEAPNFGGGGTLITGPRNVTLDGNQTVGSVTFNSAQSFELDPGTPSSSGLTLNNAPNVATIAAVAGSHTVTVPIALPASGVGVNVQDPSAALALNGAINGSGALTMSGIGTLTLAAVNGYNGTTVGSGTLDVSGNGTLGSATGALNANGGILDLGGTSQTAGTVTITGGTIQDGTLMGASYIGAGNADLGQFGTVSAVLAGPASLTNQIGILTLSGANTYTGNTVVSGGILSVSDDANFGADPVLPTPGNIVVLTGGMLSNSASFTLNTNRGIAVGPASGSGSAQIVVASGATVTYPGIIANNGSGTGGLTVNPNTSAGGNLILNGANTYTGPLTVTNGFLTLQGNQTAATGGFVIGNNSAYCDLQLEGPVVVAASNSVLVSVDGTGGSGNNAPSQLDDYSHVSNYGNLIVGREATMNIFGTWVQSGPMKVEGLGNLDATLIIRAGGTLNYTGSNFIQLNGAGTTYTHNGNLVVGGTLVTAQGIENTVANTTGTSAGALALNGGTLRLTASVPSLLFGSPGAASVTWTLGTGSSSTIDTGGFIATNYIGITGAGNLTKQGAGELVMAGTNSYSGDTTVNGGTLAIQQPTLNSGSDITIATGATLELDFAGTPPPNNTNAVNSLLVNGVSLPPGIYGGSAGGPTNLAGVGSLLVNNYSPKNPFLLGITLAPAGTLSPVFAPYGLTYSAINQPGDMPTVTVTNSDPLATDELFFNGTDMGSLASGTASAALTLGAIGSTNLVQVLVTAEDNVTTNLYTVNVMVAAPIASNPTNITATVSSGLLTLTWPADHLGWLVQSNSVSLAVPADWYDLSNTAAGTTYSIPMTPTQMNVFYRLRHP